MWGAETGCLFLREAALKLLAIAKKNSEPYWFHELRQSAWKNCVAAASSSRQ
jgi:hypothetical protein